MRPDGSPLRILAVPNVSEGRDAGTVEAIRDALVGGAEGGDRGVALLDVHSDADHHRSVYTLAGTPAAVTEALMRCAREAVARIDVMAAARAGWMRGEHPHVGALDVAPFVYLGRDTRGAAFAQALVLADRIGEELGVPVFLYGELAEAGEHSPTSDSRDTRSARIPESSRSPVSASGRTRAQLRAGGVSGLARRMATGKVRPDFGPARLHPRAGATLVAAREPLVAFNLRLAPPATVDDARRIAALIREGGAEGLPGVRAIGVRLGRERARESDAQGSGTAPESEAWRRGMPGNGVEIAQVSTNVERPLEVPLAAVIERVRRHAEIADAELVGLAPRAALEGMPEDVELPGFDPARHVIENALGAGPR
jgi:glutamate formiminotransferase / 5-formyltetrahydrofolate cyclo-ligase